MSKPSRPLASVAIVGGGVAGMTIAWLLQRVADVYLFEKNEQLGGHTRTITIASGPDAGMPVDIGFIVMNQRNYPLLARLFRQLGVALAPSEMSFGYHCEATGYAYSGSGLGGLFAQPRNLLSPRHWRLLLDIARFNLAATRDLCTGALRDRTLADYLARGPCSEAKRILQGGHYSAAFAEHYLLAMGSAIWSAPAADIRQFPALPFVRFFHNHGLLALRNRPAWQYVQGGSRTYVEAMFKSFRGKVRTGARIRRIRRRTEGATLEFDDGPEQTVGNLVLATHADEALALLADPSPAETECLGAWRYQANRVTLHTDARLMPPARRAWAAWNFIRPAGGDAQRPVTLTYHMNRLQRLPSRTPWFVTLNRDEAIDPARCEHSTVMSHPVYSFAALASQSRLRALNGTANTYYCGSYMGYGFHEDAVRSAVDVATHFGVTL